MIVTIFAPELLLGKAYSDFISARKHFAEYEKVRKEDGVEWTLSHTFLANMGGFTIVFDLDTLITENQVDKPSQEDASQVSAVADPVVQGDVVTRRSQGNSSQGSASASTSAAVEGEVKERLFSKDASQEQETVGVAVEGVCNMCSEDSPRETAH